MHMYQKLQLQILRLSRRVCCLSESTSGGGEPTVVVEALIGDSQVVTGTVSAITGLTDSSSTVSSAAFAGKRVRVTRNFQELPARDLGNGNPFYTKALGSNDVLLNIPLNDDEFIKIETIN